MSNSFLATQHADNCRFIVNKEARKVICILEPCTNLFLDYIFSYFNWYGLNRINPKTYSRLKMPVRFVGIATCSEEDTWNEELGKKIAYSRVKDKVDKSFFKRANIFINYFDTALDQIANDLNTLGMKLEHNQTKRHEYLARKLEESNT